MIYAGAGLDLAGRWQAVSGTGPGRGYVGAREHRLHRERDTSGGRPESHLTQQVLWDLRETARDLRRSNGIFRGLLARLCRNVVRGGYQLKADDRTAAWWKQWCQGCDARGRQSFWGLVRSALYATVLDGDHFWALDHGRCQILPLAGDRVLSPSQSPDKVVHGIELDGRGRPTRYFVADSKPSRTARGLGAIVSKDDGRWLLAENIRHWCHWDEELVDSVRGEPIGGVMARDFDDLEAFVVSERIAARVQANNALYVTKEDDQDLFAAAAAARDPDEQEPEQPPIERVEPGEVHYLRPREKIQSVGSTHPNQNVPEFVRLLCRCLGAAIGLPLELILLDFTLGNFSASRLAIEEAKEMFRAWQRMVLEQVEWTFVWAFEDAARRGQFGKISAAELGTLQKHSWIVQGWPYVDPLKDAKADVAGVQLGVTSRQRICAARGVDWWDIAEELGDEAAELAKRGVATSFADTADAPGTGANDQ